MAAESVDSLSNSQDTSLSLEFPPDLEGESQLQ